MSNDAAYRLDPDDPRAPTAEQWARMSEAERQRVVAELPSEFPLLEPPEGDHHRIPKESALDALGEHFRRLRRRIYISAELPVYYPGERMFAPDVIAVVDVEPHFRQSWVVSDEGKGLDFALEINVGGSSKKDLHDNVQRFARLGIHEYFVFAPRAQRLLGYRLPRAQHASAPAAPYVPILPQEGRWSSEVLGLDLAMEGERLRFFSGGAAVEQSTEIIVRLGAMVDRVTRHHEQLAVELERERERADAQTERADAQTERAERLARHLRELGIDPNSVH